MYRKRMSEALQEARAYTAVNEVMVFKGGRGMNVSKKDLPVFQAKGWKLKEELEEANMKRILQALQDKLSKEGGAAGFDDLKKTAKSMGLDLTPQMLKNMPGIKQHRDGDYILEELEEQKRELMLTYGKPGEKVKAYYTMFMQDLQNKASELRKKGFVVDKMGLKQPMSKLRDRIPEELDTDLEEAFTRKDFQKLETTNDHTEAAEKLINMFGTSDEKKEMKDIKARHQKTGYISGKDYSKRQMMVNKYYSRLK